MTRKKKIVIGMLAVPLVLLCAFVIVVGPWPVYGDSGYASTAYYHEALREIETRAGQNSRTSDPGPLAAGWAARKITPPVGAPLGGYGARKDGMKSTGVRDELHVRALALSDGVDTAVIVGSDMLIIPPNLSSAVRENVAKACGLNASQILFNASHTHCGPGGFMPGLAAKLSGGEYNEGVVNDLIASFTEAIVEAQGRMEPAALASGSVNAPEYIRNRMRDGAPVDRELSFMLVKQEDGDTCYVASYSAHPTIFGARMMAFSAEYPGELMRHIERETRHTAHYLGGAVGAMGPRAPEGEDEASRVVAMGQALGELILAHDDGLEFSNRLDIAAAGVPVGMPPFQVRPLEDSPDWRLSPVAARLAGLRREGWIHGVRVGNVFFVGMPFDFCGETSVEWKAWAEGEGLDLWTLSFCSTYCGYFSPDKYYRETPLNYETGAMSWFGPNVEAYFTDLFHHLVDGLAVPEGGQ